MLEFEEQKGKKEGKIVQKRDTWTLNMDLLETLAKYLKAREEWVNVKEGCV